MSTTTATTTSEIIGCLILCKGRGMDTVIKRLEEWFAEREDGTLLNQHYGEKKGNGLVFLGLSGHESYDWLADLLAAEKCVTDYLFYEEADFDDSDEEEEE